MAKKIYIGSTQVAGLLGKSAYQSWLDQGHTGTEVDFLAWCKGVGFQSVSSQQDGTIVITLTNGDTVTVDLNHNHPQYPKYVLCASQAAYDAITTKDSETLYLIPAE